MGYLSRHADSRLRDLLGFTPGIIIEGPRACGKTYTGRKHSASNVMLDTSEGQLLAEAGVGEVIRGAQPRLLDEWQVLPQLFNEVRHAIDRDPRPGQFILTGSAVPSDDLTRHTGAGRFLRLRLRTMTVIEAYPSSFGGASLQEIFAGHRVPTNPRRLELAEVAELLVRGGWPAQLSLTPAQAVERNRAYLNESLLADLKRIDDIRLSQPQLSLLIRSLARNVATEASIRTLAQDAGTRSEGPLPETTGRYLELLRRIFLLEEQEPWFPQLRSRAILRQAPKRHLADPSLAVAALGFTMPTLMKDLQSFGFIFESAVYHHLASVSESLGGRVFHYRDSNGLEVDAIVQLPDGRWGAIEVKIGLGGVEPAVANLQRLTRTVNQELVGKPSFLAVVTATGSQLTRSDGIHLLPWWALDR